MNSRLKKIAADDTSLSEEQLIAEYSKDFCNVYYSEVMNSAAENIAEAAKNANNLTDMSEIKLSIIINKAIMDCVSSNFDTTIKHFCEDNNVSEYVVDALDEDRETIVKAIGMEFEAKK